jgi:hypothetical protein
MSAVLRIAGWWNLLAGLAMILFYHEGFKALGATKPSPALSIQVLGVLVALFGWGYHLVASDPVRNRNLLMLGFWSKAAATMLAGAYVAMGRLPWWFAVVVFLADTIYLPPFFAILRRIDNAVAMQRH